LVGLLVLPSPAAGVDDADGAGEDVETDLGSLLQLGLQVQRQVPGTYRQALHNAMDVQYTGDITMGGQSLRAVLDTGSFEILVFSKDCSSCGRAGAYDFRQSSTYSSGRLATTHAFGSGTCFCLDGTDRLEVGPYRVEDQDFWEVTRADMPLLKTATFSAIVGLAPPGKPQLEAAKLMQGSSNDRTIGQLLLKKRDSLLANLGGRYFSACFEWASGAPGYLIWNDVAPQQRLVPFVEIKVTSSLYWDVELTAPHFAQVGGSSGSTVGLGCKNGCQALLDTGTSLIAVPQATYKAALKQLKSIDVNCIDIGKMPDLVFTLGGHTFSLPPQVYIGVIYGPIPEHSRHLFPEGKTRVPVACQLLLMSTGFLGGEKWIFGMPFFRYYYATFDLGKDIYSSDGRRVWVSPATADCTPTDQIGFAQKVQHAKSQRPWRVNGSMIHPPRWAGKPGKDPKLREFIDASQDPDTAASARERKRL